MQNAEARRAALWRSFTRQRSASPMGRWGARVNQRKSQPLSPYELKKGSVIPATMITGVNSDLPGRMIAQVNQNVYDSATGRYLLIPQGSRLFGRYDANVTYGQERVLVVWTDLTFPDGSTLHLGAMAG